MMTDKANTTDTKVYKDTKICRDCHLEKPRDEFYNRTSSADGKENKCKPCRKKINSVWESKNKKRKAHLNRKRMLAKYGITVTEYDALLEEQEGCCAICGITPEKQGKRLVVDHNHETGEVRGLLCRNCNVGIGALGDSYQNLINAASYLEERGQYGRRK